MSLVLRTGIRSVPFLIYIRQEQAKRPKHHKLNVFQLMAIYNVCFNDGLDVKPTTVDELVNEGIILRAKSGKLTMSKDYRKLVVEIAHHDGRDGEINGEINGDVKALSGSLREVYLIVLNKAGIKIKQAVVL